MTVAANAQRHGGHLLPLDPVVWTGIRLGAATGPIVCVRTPQYNDLSHV